MLLCIGLPETLWVSIYYEREMFLRADLINQDAK